MNLKKMAMKTVAGAALLATMSGCGSSEQKNVSNDSARVDSTALLQKETDSLNQQTDSLNAHFNHYMTLGMDDIKVDTMSGVVVIKGEILSDDPPSHNFEKYDFKLGKKMTLTLGLKDENHKAIKTGMGRNGVLDATGLGFSALPKYNDGSMQLETEMDLIKGEALVLTIIADKKSAPKALSKMIENLGATEENKVNTRFAFTLDKK